MGQERRTQAWELERCRVYIKTGQGGWTEAWVKRRKARAALKIFTIFSSLPTEISTLESVRHL